MSTTEPAAAAALAPFDHHSPAFATGWREAYAGMRASCPVVHTPAHGGFWVVTGYDEVRTALLDKETFVCGRDLEVPGVEGVVSGGVTIPTNPWRMGMMEMDGPRAQRLRRIILPWLSARAVEEHQDRLDELVTWLLDRVTPTGAMDVVDDLANPLPALVTLDLLGLPLERWSTYADVLHAAAYRRPGSARQVAALLEDLTATVEERQAALRPTSARTSARTPGGPAPSCALDALVLAEVDGTPLRTAEVVELVFMLLNGGVDTSTAVIAHLLAHLDAHPSQRAELQARPDLVPGYVDDLIRWVTPGTGVARTVRRPCELGGVALRPGDRLLLALGAADNDPAVFPDPDDVRSEGRQPPHLAFGAGAHRCVGAGLATAEIVTVARHVLDRIPDYRIDRSRVEAYPTIPLVAGYVRMPASFSPTPAVGPGGGDLPPSRRAAARRPVAAAATGGAA